MKPYLTSGSHAFITVQFWKCDLWGGKFQSVQHIVADFYTAVFLSFTTAVKISGPFSLPNDEWEVILDSFLFNYN